MFYLRRGERVMGPYTPRALKELATTGQLQTGDMISEDEATWSRVEEVRGLHVAGAGSAARRAFDVFLSYSKYNKLEADAICSRLEARGIRCWIAPRDITPGTEWTESIIDGIEQSRVMLLVFSEHANQSAQVRREVERAISKELPVVPFRVQNVKPARALEFCLGNTHWFDAFDPPLEQHIDRLADIVRRLLADRNPVGIEAALCDPEPPAPAAAAPPPAPMPGAASQAAPAAQVDSTPVPAAIPEPVAAPPAPPAEPPAAPTPAVVRPAPVPTAAPATGADWSLEEAQKRRLQKSMVALLLLGVAGIVAVAIAFNHGDDREAGPVHSDSSQPALASAPAPAADEGAAARAAAQAAAAAQARQAEDDRNKALARTDYETARDAFTRASALLDTAPRTPDAPHAESQAAISKALAEVPKNPPDDTESYRAAAAAYGEALADINAATKALAGEEHDNLLKARQDFYTARTTYTRAVNQWRELKLTAAFDHTASRAAEAAAEKSLPPESTTYEAYVSGAAAYGTAADEVTEAIQSAQREEQTQAATLNTAKSAGNTAWNAKNYAEALKQYKIAAALGEDSAMDFVGLIYEEGLAGAPDYAQAMVWYKRAADAGLANGMTNMGDLYGDGHGVTKDSKEAFRWYQMGADHGDQRGTLMVGKYYEDGRAGAVDFQKAAAWYQKAIDLGNVMALNELGWMYLQGQGVAKDPDKAMALFQKGAAAGVPEAMCNIGSMYVLGDGVPKSYDQALTWFRKSADAGNGTAMQFIGYMYENGFGVPRDKAAAIEWYQKAVAAGDDSAKDALKRLGK